MAKFLQNLGLFLLTVFLGLLALIWATNTRIEKKAKFRDIKNSEVLVVGNSRPQCAYNDTLIDNFKNYSSSAESYLFSYLKLKLLLRDNKHVKYVLLEFSQSNFDYNRSYDKAGIWSDAAFTSRYQLYAPYFSMNEYVLFAKMNRTVFFTHQNLLLINNFSVIYDHDYNRFYNNRFGGYLRLDSFINKAKYNSDKDSNRSMINTTLSNYQIKYLNEIVDFLKVKNIKLILIRCPLNEKAMNGDLDREVYRIKNKYFSQLDFFDFAAMKFLDQEFADVTHLNYWGAKRFSIFFNQLIKDGFPNNIVNKNILDQKIKKFNYNSN